MNSLKDFMISHDELSDVAFESYVDSYIATEGVNWDTNKEIKNSPEFREIVETYKRLGKSIRACRKAIDKVSAYAVILKELNKFDALIDKCKVVIDKKPELTGWWSKFCSMMTPTSWRIPDASHSYSVSPVYSYGNSGGGLTFVITDTATYYEDKMSKYTNSSVKRTYQHKMNYLHHWVKVRRDECMKQMTIAKKLAAQSKK